MTASEAILQAMGWAEDKKDSPGQMKFDFGAGNKTNPASASDVVSSWTQKFSKPKGGAGVGAVPSANAGGGSPAGTPQGELEKHDKKSHPGGYKGGRCAVRGRLAKQGFDVRGYDAKVSNFTAPEGYDYEAKHGEGDEEEDESTSAVVEEPKKEGKVSPDEVLPEAEKVQIGDIEGFARTTDAEKIANILSQLETDPEKVIAENPAFEGLSPEEVKDKLQKAIDKLKENPSVNGTQQPQQEMAAQAEAQREQTAEAGKKLTDEITSEAGKLNLLVEEYNKAAEEAAQLIEAHPEQEANIKAELAKERSKFEKDFQKIDPVAENDDGTQESPEDHAKHCKANPKSNCPFLRESMSEEQLQQLDTQQKAEEGETKETPEDQEVIEQEESLSGAMSDEDYAIAKESDAVKDFKQQLRDYFDNGGTKIDNDEVVPDSVYDRAMKEVLAEYVEKGVKIKEGEEVIEEKKEEEKKDEGSEPKVEIIDFGEKEEETEPAKAPESGGTTVEGGETKSGEIPDISEQERKALEYASELIGQSMAELEKDVTEEKVKQLIDRINLFQETRDKWASRPTDNVSRNDIRNDLTGLSDSNIKKDYDQILADKMEAFLSNDNVPDECKASLNRLIPALRDPNLTDKEADRIYKRIADLKARYGLDDLNHTKVKNEKADIEDRYLEDGDENHRNGGVVSSTDEYPEWNAKLDELKGEDKNGVINNADEIKEKIANDLADSGLQISVDDIEEKNNIFTTDFTVKFPKDIKPKEKDVESLKRAIETNFPIDSKRGLAINYDLRTNSLTVTAENDEKGNISQKTLLKSPEFQAMIDKGEVPIAVGIDAEGKPVISSLSDYTHILLAGQTDSGKSARLGSILASLLAQSPDNVKIIAIDPKSVEFSFLKGDPHLLGDVVTEGKDAISKLRYAVNEQENRYRLLTKAGVRNLQEYNALSKAGKLPAGLPKKLPVIPVIVDEFADLMDTNGKDVEGLVKRLGQKARAAGIHLILATQRPTAKSISGEIKANIPTKFGLHVGDKREAGIVGIENLETLPGKGPLIIQTKSGKPTRVDGSYIDLDGLEKMVKNGMENPRSEPKPSIPFPEQVIEGLAKNPKQKAGLQKVADKIAKGDTTPLGVPEWMADATKKLLESQGIGYTEMKGADGKVTITPKPKEQGTASSPSTKEVSQGAAEKMKTQDALRKSFLREDGTVNKEKFNELAEKIQQMRPLLGTAKETPGMKEEFFKLIKTQNAVYFPMNEQDVNIASKAVDNLVGIPVPDGKGNVKNTPYINHNGRIMVLADINGMKIPFYKSTGKGQKHDVESGKFYPAFGVGKQGWINKTSGASINTYYGSPTLRAICEALDEKFQNIDENSIPSLELGRSWGQKEESQQAKSVRDFINQSMKEAPGDDHADITGTEDTHGIVKRNAANVISHLNNLRKGDSSTFPSEGTQEAKPIETPEGTSSPEGNNTPESGAGGTSESGSEGDANAERNSIAESKRGRYDAYHRDFDKAIVKAFETIDKKTASGKEITGADYDQADAQVASAIAMVNQFREKNGLPLVKELDEDRKPVFEKKEEPVTEETPAPEPESESTEPQGIQIKEDTSKLDRYQKMAYNAAIKKYNEGMAELEAKLESGKLEYGDFQTKAGGLLKKLNGSRASVGLTGAVKNDGTFEEVKQETTASESPAAEETTEETETKETIVPPMDAPEDEPTTREDDEAAGEAEEETTRTVEVPESQGRSRMGRKAQGDRLKAAAKAALKENNNSQVQPQGLSSRNDDDDELPTPDDVKPPKTPKGKKPSKGGDNDSPDDGGGDDNGGGGGSGGGSKGSTEASTENASVAQPEKPAPKVETPAPEPKAPTDEEVETQVNSSDRIKTLEKQVKTAKTAQERRVAESRLNQAKKSLGAAIRTAATQESGARDVRTKKPASQTGNTTPDKKTTPSAKKPEAKKETAPVKKETPVKKKPAEVKKESLNKAAPTTKTPAPSASKNKKESAKTTTTQSNPQQQSQPRNVTPAAKKEEPASAPQQTPEQPKKQEGTKNQEPEKPTPAPEATETPQAKAYREQKEAEKKKQEAEAAKQAAERQKRLEEARNRGGDASRGLNRQFQEFVKKAMEKADPNKSKAYKALSAMKPPKKIDNESANAINRQFDEVAKEIEGLEAELRQNQEERTLKPAQIQEKQRLIGHLRQGLQDVISNKKLGQGNFTIRKVVDPVSGSLRSLHIESFKGPDGKSTKVTPIEEKKATTTEKQESSTNRQETNSQETTKNKTNNQQNSSFGDIDAYRQRLEDETSAIQKRIDAIKARKLKGKGKNKDSDAKTEDSGDFEEISEADQIWIEVFDAALVGFSHSQGITENCTTQTSQFQALIPLSKSV